MARCARALRKRSNRADPEEMTRARGTQAGWLLFQSFPARPQRRRTLRRARMAVGALAVSAARERSTAFGEPEMIALQRL